MRPSLILLLFISFSLVSISQEQNKESNDTAPVLEEHRASANFPGGSEMIYKFIVQNMEYPDEAKEKGIEGIVVCFLGFPQS